MNGRAPPTVAVVIPCFNGERYVGETLHSVLAQEDVDVHVVVVDDGSTDGSTTVVAGIAGSDERVHVVRQANAGVAAARNRGLGAVPPAAEAVMFLDADDVLEPQALERLAAALDAACDAVAAVGPHIRIDQNGGRLGSATAAFGAHVIDARGKVRWVDAVAELTWRHFLPGNAVFTPGQCLVRREAIPKRPFHRRFTPAEDWDLWLRITHDRPIVTVPEPVLQYRDHPGGLSKGYERMRAARREVLRSHRAACPAHAREFDTAYWFVMYRADRWLNLRWARDQLRRGRPIGGLRFVARAGKLVATELVARLADRRTPWWTGEQGPDGSPGGAASPGVTELAPKDPRDGARPAPARDGATS